MFKIAAQPADPKCRTGAGASRVPDTAHASRLFALEELGNIYTRVQNPTWDALETRITALEGGAAALAVASGQAASAYSVLNLAQAGDNIVSSTDLYGGTWTLFAQTLKQFGIEARFVDPSDPEAFRRATDAKTRAYYAEILPNPKLHVFPIREVADIGRSLGVPLIADNTATPLIARPFEHGAAVVVYSATKYIGGHGASIGGLIIDGGNFPWEQHAERFPLLTQPDEAYHGAIWTEAAKPLGPIAYALCARVKLLRDIGAAISPFNAFQLLQGLETLPLRLRQHNENAVTVANFLKDSVTVEQSGLATTLNPGASPNGQSGRVLVSWSKPPTRVRHELIPPAKGSRDDPRAIRAETRSNLLAAIAKAGANLDDLVAGRVQDIAEIAAREQRSVRSASMLLSLAFLAPNLVKATIERRLPRGIGLTQMMDLPADWAEQHQALGLRPNLL
jgi:cystathionine beta-lyase/cystathionine gamma-synthase